MGHVMSETPAVAEARGQASSSQPVIVAAYRRRCNWQFCHGAAAADLMN